MWSGFFTRSRQSLSCVERVKNPLHIIRQLRNRAFDC